MSGYLWEGSYVSLGPCWIPGEGVGNKALYLYTGVWRRSTPVSILAKSRVLPSVPPGLQACDNTQCHWPQILTWSLLGGNSRALLVHQFHTSPPQELLELLDPRLLHSSNGKPDTSLLTAYPSTSLCWYWAIPSTSLWACALSKEGSSLVSRRSLRHATVRVVAQCSTVPRSPQTHLNCYCSFLLLWGMLPCGACWKCICLPHPPGGEVGRVSTLYLSTVHSWDLSTLCL